MIIAQNAKKSPEHPNQFILTPRKGEARCGYGGRGAPLTQAAREMQVSKR